MIYTFIITISNDHYCFDHNILNSDCRKMSIEKSLGVRVDHKRFQDDEICTAFRHIKLEQNALHPNGSVRLYTYG